METSNSIKELQSIFLDKTKREEYHKEYDRLYKNCEESFKDPLILDYYVLSTKFLQEWKGFVRYSEPYRYEIPETYNKDLMASDDVLRKFLKPGKYKLLRNDLKISIDYILIDKNLKVFFNKFFKGFEIHRKAIIMPDNNKFVEVNLKQINVCAIDKKFLITLEKTENLELGIYKFQISSQSSFQLLRSELFEAIDMKIKNRLEGFKPDQMRIWKVKDSDIFIKYLKKNCSVSKSFFEYSIVMEGTLLEGNPDITIDELSISETEFLVIEIRSPREKWFFTQEGVKQLVKCIYCSKYEENFITCICSKVFYCSKECKNYNKKIHKNNCELSEKLSDEEEIIDKKKNYQSDLENNNVEKSTYYSKNIINNYLEDSQTNNKKLFKCNFCSRYEEKLIMCSCKKIGYCSIDCKNRNKKYHKKNCTSERISSDEDNEMIEQTNLSKMGITGLSNLGNTCFMNSALQCLSNTFELTKYFIENKHINEINLTNALGYKGKLAREYANFINSLWFGKNDTFSPYLLKSTIAEKNTMFYGYNQHDSQEFLLCILDGLHEDLNRIKEKPYVQIPDFNQSTSDQLISSTSWECYLKRNQSIITDMMMGQFKSTIICPDCKKVSITMDPFLSWSLPLKESNPKFLSIKFYPANIKQFPYKFKFMLRSEIHNLSLLKINLASKLQINPENTRFIGMGQRSFEIINESSSTKEIRKKFKRSILDLCLIELTEYEKSIPDSEKINLFVKCLTQETFQWSSSSYKKEFYTRPFQFSLNDTFKDIHRKIFRFFRPYFENTEELDGDTEKLNSDEEFYKYIFNDQSPYELNWGTSYSSFDPCEFCSKKYCNGCSLEQCDKELKTIKDVDNCKIEMHWAKEQKEINKMMNNWREEKEIKDEMENEEEEKEKKETNNTSIYECMKEFGTPEILDEKNPWYCNNCKNHKQAMKQMQVYKAPRFLIIHLKRFKTKQHSYFRQNHRKNNTKIDFPINGLNLADYVLNQNLLNENICPEFESNNLIYDLYAISNHSGGLEGGHYYCYAKNYIKNEWFCFNDSSVRSMNEQSICTEAAYCLFYERRNLKNTFNKFEIQNKKKSIIKEDNLFLQEKNKFQEDEKYFFNNKKIEIEDEEKKGPL